MFDFLVLWFLCGDGLFIDVCHLWPSWPSRLCLSFLKQCVISILFGALRKGPREQTDPYGKCHLALVSVSLNCIKTDKSFFQSSCWKPPYLSSVFFCNFPKLSPSRLLCTHPHTSLYPAPAPRIPVMPFLSAIPPELSGIPVQWPTSIHPWSLPRRLSSLSPSTETGSPLRIWMLGPFQVEGPHNPGPGRAWHSSNAILLLSNHDFAPTNVSH